MHSRYIIVAIIIIFISLFHKCILCWPSGFCGQLRKLFSGKGLLRLFLLVIGVYCIYQVFPSTGYTISLTGNPKEKGQYVKQAGLKSPVSALILLRNGHVKGSKNLINLNTVNFDRLADAIKKAENSKSHPYGIIAPYCTAKTPERCRKGCLQTIRKRHGMWLRTNPRVLSVNAFISYLSASYAPLGANNDPLNLNFNWTRNVTGFYERATNGGNLV